MSLNANESGQLATLTDDVGRMAGTVDDLLALLRTAGQGGAVDIATHNNNAAAHGGVTGKVAAMRTQLTADAIFYLSAAGNDANDGKTAGTAKATWAGMQKLLSGIDPREYKATVKISGLVPGSTVNLPGYDSQNLVLEGTSTANDGFSSALNFLTGASCSNIQHGEMLVYGGIVQLVGKNRLVGNSSATPGYVVRSPGRLVLVGTIEYAGVFGAVIVADSAGHVWISSPTFTQIGTPVFDYFIRAVRVGTVSQFPSAYNGDALPSIATYHMYQEGCVPYLDPNAPGGGTVVCTPSGRIAAQGVARAVGQVSSAGGLSKSFGIESVTKTATGVYQIVHGLSNPVAIVTLVTGGSLGSAVVDGANNTTIVRTFNAAGAVGDCAFNIEIF
jgi:hypothetical protein